MPKQKKMQWVLPDIVDPKDTICFQVHVPNERHHIAAFYGAIFLLSKPYAWGDDQAHTALAVGKVWRKIFDNLRRGCDCEQPRTGLGDCEEYMGCCIRFESGKFQTLNCGVWEDIPGQPSGGLLGGGQPGSGAPQPQPGGCQSYHAQLLGNGVWLLPTPVSSGDTIQVSGAIGATNDGGSTAWYCPDGEQFFAGACVGFPVLDGADPLPMISHMKLIAKIGAIFYDVYGAAFSVPGGHTNDQVEFQVNDDDLADNAGSMSFDALICNNQSQGIDHEYRFASNPSGWIAPMTAGGGLQNGVWAAGQGFADTLHSASGFDFRAAGAMKLDFSSFTLTDFVVRFNLIPGTNSSGGSAGIFLLDQADATLASIAWNAEIAANDQIIEFHGSHPGTTGLKIFVGASNVPGAGDGGGSALITSAHVSGV